MQDTATGNATSRFALSLPLAEDFPGSLGDSRHLPVPDDWLVAVTDVVRSREAIAQGRYKAVNMAGAAMIAGLMNALGTRDIPYIFGGDGAAVAIAPQDAATAGDVLSSLAVFVAEELSLQLRAALVPVSRIRADGFDLKVEAVRVSAAIRNYSFEGGGISQAEKLMKAGEYAVAPGAPGSRPDLTGLSCRWLPVEAPGRSILSLIVEPGAAGAGADFIAACRRILREAGGEGQGASPVPPEGPGVGYPPEGLEMEARLSRGPRSLWRARIGLQAETLLAWFLFRTGIRLGGFSPAQYRKVTGLNTDFRKWQDGLRMTVSLDPAAIASLRAVLKEEKEAGRIDYGLCIQDRAVLTCFVPSVLDDAHFHFLDGAGGGYAEAASDLARSRQAA
jgi:hypothetical protein